MNTWFRGTASTDTEALGAVSPPCIRKQIVRKETNARWLSGEPINPVQWGDNPNNNGQDSGPRDPDKFDVFSTSSDGQTTVVVSSELYTHIT